MLGVLLKSVVIVVETVWRLVLRVGCLVVCTPRRGIGRVAYNPVRGGARRCAWLWLLCVWNCLVWAVSVLLVPGRSRPNVYLLMMMVTEIVSMVLVKYLRTCQWENVIV